MRGDTPADLQDLVTQCERVVVFFSSALPSFLRLPPPDERHMDLCFSLLLMERQAKRNGKIKRPSALKSATFSCNLKYTT